MFSIQLKPNDLYDITFTNWNRSDLSDLTQRTIPDVYAVQINDIIEKETGLYTKLASGGIINQYRNKSAKDVWNSWTVNQRRHFIIDHDVLKPFMKKENAGVLNKKWDELPEDIEGIYIKGVIDNHVYIGQYDKGGIVKLCPIGTQIQSLVFSKDSFSKAQASDWAKTHGFKYGVDEKQNTFRLRQQNPSLFKKHSFRTADFDKKLPKGIQAVIACPKTK